jgi:hypothetical protein
VVENGLFENNIIPLKRKAKSTENSLSYPGDELCKALPLMRSSFPSSGRSLHTKVCLWGPRGSAVWYSNSTRGKRRDESNKKVATGSFHLTCLIYGKKRKQTPLSEM